MDLARSRPVVEVDLHADPLQIPVENADPDTGRDLVGIDEAFSERGDVVGGVVAAAGNRDRGRIHDRSGRVEFPELDPAGLHGGHHRRVGTEAGDFRRGIAQRRRRAVKLADVPQGGLDRPHGRGVERHGMEAAARAGATAAAGDDDERAAADVHDPDRVDGTGDGGLGLGAGPRPVRRREPETRLQFIGRAVPQHGGADVLALRDVTGRRGNADLIGGGALRGRGIAVAVEAHEDGKARAPEARRPVRDETVGIGIVAFRKTPADGDVEIPPTPPPGIVAGEIGEAVDLPDGGETLLRVDDADENAVEVGGRVPVVPDHRDLVRPRQPRDGGAGVWPGPGREGPRLREPVERALVRCELRSALAGRRARAAGQQGGHEQKGGKNASRGHGNYLKQPSNDLKIPFIGGVSCQRRRCEILPGWLSGGAGDGEGAGWGSPATGDWRGLPWRRRDARPW